MHIIIGMPLQLIIMGMPMPIMVIMRVQHSFIMSMVMPAMGFMVQTMPSAVISQVMVQVITGIIIGIMPFMPPIMGIIPFIMGICIMGIMPPIMVMGIWFIIGMVVGICMAVIMVLVPRDGQGAGSGGPRCLSRLTMRPPAPRLNRSAGDPCAFIQ